MGSVAVGHRVEAVETGQDKLMQTVTSIQDHAKRHDEVLNSLLDQLDDHGNETATRISIYEVCLKQHAPLICSLQCRASFKIMSKSWGIPHWTPL